MRPGALSPSTVPFRFGGLLLSCVTVLLLVVGCGDEEAGDSADKSPLSTHTLVFVDQSISTGDYPQAQALFADSMARIVHRHLRRPGDRLSLFFVHKKTLSKAHHIDVRNDVAPMKETEFPDERALEQARFRREIEQFLDQTAGRLRDAIRSPPSTPDFTRWTDVWGTLGVASQEFTSAPHRRYIYYFSDMYESMPGPGRRNFDARPPQSRAQAEQWARTDADTLDTHMILRPDRLRPARIRVILGTLATKPHAQDVKFYWLTLFDQLGIPRRQVRYN